MSSVDCRVESRVEVENSRLDSRAVAIAIRYPLVDSRWRVATDTASASFLFLKLHPSLHYFISQPFFQDLRVLSIPNSLVLTLAKVFNSSSLCIQKPTKNWSKQSARHKILGRVEPEEQMSPRATFVIYTERNCILNFNVHILHNFGTIQVLYENWVVNIY